jgi:hypothetical protein
LARTVLVFSIARHVIEYFVEFIGNFCHDFINSGIAIDQDHIFWDITVY